MNYLHIAIILLWQFSFVILFHHRRIKIWGPGLHPSDIVMPARYFFIETNDFEDSNHNINVTFQVNIEGINKYNKPCRVWITQLNRKDGSYIVRYKVFEVCYKTRILILLEGQHVAGSPYNITGIVNPDECSCPLSSFEKWRKVWGCGDIPEQIENDLKPFTKVNFLKIGNKITSKFNNPAGNSLCHYVILNNEIHRKCYGKYVGFKMFMDSILLSLCRKVQLNNVEMFVNLGDWPLIQKEIFSNIDIMPMFSWCGSDDSYDIVMPTYDITESTLENMGRVTLDMLSVQGNTNYPWEKRIEKIFWRGRDSNRQRLKLIEISRKYPELFNASLTNFFFFRNEEEIYGPKTDHVSLFKFFEYKYQLNIDGTVAAYRLPYLLAGGSLLFKQNSKYYEHFYKKLKPFEHFVPVKADLSDLVERLSWAINNDDEANRIANEGKTFARENLLPKDVFCYYGHLLNEWSKKISNDITVLEDMEHVEQPTSKIDNCHCDIEENNKDEL